MARMRWVATIGVAAGLLALPAAASAEVLYDQLSGASPVPLADGGARNFSPSNEFSPANFDRTADDFSVPAGNTWKIEQIDVTGAFNPDPPGAVVNVYLYEDAAGKPGAEIFSQRDITATGGPNYTVPVTNVPALTAGTYWVTVQHQVGSGAYWTWGTHPTQTGSLAHFISATPLPPPCDTVFVWQPRRACWTGPGPAASDPDQAFRLSGTDLTPQPSNQFQIGKPTRNLRKGTARVPVTVPGTGGLTLRGPQIVARQKNIFGARTVRVTLIPRGAAKRKLNNTGTARVQVKFTFRPGGGTARTKTRFIRLRKRLN